LQYFYCNLSIKFLFVFFVPTKKRIRFPFSSFFYLLSLVWWRTVELLSLLWDSAFLKLISNVTVPFTPTFLFVFVFVKSNCLGLSQQFGQNFPWVIHQSQKVLSNQIVVPNLYCNSLGSSDFSCRKVYCQSFVPYRIKSFVFDSSFSKCFEMAFVVCSKNKKRIRKSIRVTNSEIVSFYCFHCENSFLKRQIVSGNFFGVRFLGSSVEYFFQKLVYVGVVKRADFNITNCSQFFTFFLCIFLFLFLLSSSFFFLFDFIVFLKLNLWMMN